MHQVPAETIGTDILPSRQITSTPETSSTTRIPTSRQITSTETSGTTTPSYMQIAPTHVTGEGSGTNILIYIQIPSTHVSTETSMTKIAPSTLITQATCTLVPAETSGTNIA